MANTILTPEVIAYEMAYIAQTLKLATDLTVHFPDRPSTYHVWHKSRRKPKSLKVTMNYFDLPLTNSLDMLRPALTAALVEAAGAV
jgi:hypothetical protein